MKVLAYHPMVLEVSVDPGASVMAMEISEAEAEVTAEQCWR